MTPQETKKALRKLATRYREDPVFFAEHALGVYTWSKMREVLRSVKENKRTLCYACHGSSKTFTAAILTVWFFNIYLNLDPKAITKVVTTAPVGRQVKYMLWGDINKVYRESRIMLSGRCLTTEITTDHKEKKAIGFATDEQKRAEGWHAWNLLFVFDEAKGIPPWMWDVAEAQMGGGNSRFLAISTTDGVIPGSEFERASKSDAWNKIKIDCRELPTFTRERLRSYTWNDAHGFDFTRVESTADDLKIQISTPEWEDGCIDKWGVDDPLYITKCRAEILDTQPNQLIETWRIMRAFENAENQGFDDTGAIEIGIDVAREGDDSTEIYKRKGMKVINHLTLTKMEGFEIVDAMEEAGFITPDVTAIKVDDTGVGAGVTSTLLERFKNKLKNPENYVIYSNMEIKPVKFNQLPNDPDLYPSAIDEMWYTMRDLLPDISCPYDKELLQQVAGRLSITLDAKGRRRAEPKKEYKKRMGGKSPDKMDAFALCFYEPASGPIGQAQSRVVKKDEKRAGGQRRGIYAR